MATIDTRTDQPYLGMLFMLGFCVVIPFSDAIGKLLGSTFPLFQLVLVRFGMQALIFTPIALATKARLRVSQRLLGLLVLRTALQVCGILLIFAALRFMPLADAIAIVFVLPFIMLLLGHFILNEAVGKRRLIACAVGFCGTLMVIQPSFVAVGIVALLPLGVAIIFAFFMIVTRFIAKEVDPIALQASSGLIAMPVLLATAFLEPAGTASVVGWIWPDGQAFWLFVALGLTGSLGHLLMTMSLQLAPATTLAPMQYLEIPMATAVGYLIFNEFPNGLAALGIAVTMAAGLYIIFRERAASRVTAQV